MCATGDTEGEKETVFTDPTEAPRESGRKITNYDICSEEPLSSHC